MIPVTFWLHWASTAWIEEEQATSRLGLRIFGLNMFRLIIINWDTQVQQTKIPWTFIKAWPGSNCHTKEWARAVFSGCSIETWTRLRLNGFLKARKFKVRSSSKQGMPARPRSSQCELFFSANYDIDLSRFLLPAELTFGFHLGSVQWSFGKTVNYSVWNRIAILLKFLHL